MIGTIGNALLNYYPLPNTVEKLGSRDNLAVRISVGWETSVNPFPKSDLGTFPSTTDTPSTLVGISETHIFTPTLINEFRAGLTRTKDQEIGGHSGRDIAQQLGIPGTTQNPALEGFPLFSPITGYETLGDNSSDPIRFVVNNYNYSDVMTWSKGRTLSGSAPKPCGFNIFSRLTPTSTALSAARGHTRATPSRICC
jgi:hypothetical protein